MKYYYDVVLSFASEDRESVEECADILTALGVKVFYDSYEQDALGGEDLYTFFTDIYLIKQNMLLYLCRNIMLRNNGLSMSLNLLTKECLKVKQGICCHFF